jgi:lipoprotein NlpD
MMTLTRSLNTASPAPRRPSAVVLLLCGLVLATGCAQQRGLRAPVEERSASNKPATAPAAAAAASAPAASSPPSMSEASPAVTKPPLGIENAGKPGYYAVKPGDTLIRIGLDNGQNWRDVARWNGLDNPNVIEVGQVLRVLPPDANGVASTKPVTPLGKVDSKPLDVKPGTAVTTATPGATPPAAPGAVASTSTPPTPAATTTPREPDEDLNWLWPANGPVATAFDDAKSKGVDIVGKAGDPVFAAADGRVVYAGAGLRGLGNLIIVKHNNTYLTAYAHNQTLLVKEEQAVRRGQKIAEMGNSDAERVQLHFEIRRQGKPIDPTKLLPAR